MFRYTRLSSDEQGLARFEDVEVVLDPADPAPDQLSVSAPMSARRPCCSVEPPPGAVIRSNRRHAGSS